MIIGRWSSNGQLSDLNGVSGLQRIDKVFYHHTMSAFTEKELAIDIQSINSQTGDTLCVYVSNRHSIIISCFGDRQTDKSIFYEYNLKNKSCALLPQCADSDKFKDDFDLLGAFLREESLNIAFGIQKGDTNIDEPFIMPFTLLHNRFDNGNVSRFDGFDTSKIFIPQRNEIHFFTYSDEHIVIIFHSLSSLQMAVYAQIIKNIHNNYDRSMALESLSFMRMCCTSPRLAIGKMMNKNNKISNKLKQKVYGQSIEKTSIKIQQMHNASTP